VRVVTATRVASLCGSNARRVHFSRSHHTATFSTLSEQHGVQQLLLRACCLPLLYRVALALPAYACAARCRSHAARVPAAARAAGAGGAMLLCAASMLYLSKFCHSSARLYLYTPDGVTAASRGGQRWKADRRRISAALIACACSAATFSATTRFGARDLAVRRARFRSSFSSPAGMACSCSACCLSVGRRGTDALRSKHSTRLDAHARFSLRFVGRVARVDALQRLWVGCWLSLSCLRRSGRRSAQRRYSPRTSLAPAYQQCLFAAGAAALARLFSIYLCSVDLLALYADGWQNASSVPGGFFCQAALFSLALYAYAQLSEGASGWACRRLFIFVHIHSIAAICGQQRCVPRRTQK